MKITSDKGTAVVEFAVVLPLLLIIVFGIIEFSLLLYNQAMITNAAREGARLGILVRENDNRWSTGDITAWVNKYSESYLVTFKSGAPTMPQTITYVNDVPADPAVVKMESAVDYLTVEVTYIYDFLILPSFITKLGLNQTLFARATMRAE